MPSCLYMQFLTRNVIFRSKINNSDTQRPKRRKNETRQFRKKRLIFLINPFKGNPSTVAVWWGLNPEWLNPEWVLVLVLVVLVVVLVVLAVVSE